MSIGFIGAGRVGTAFGLYLQQKGFTLSGYSSRSESSGMLAAEKTHSTYYNDLKQLSEASDLVFITTSDDQIENVVEQLCSHTCLRQGQLLVHMSGALPSTVLASAKDFGCHIYSMHPLQAFADTDKAAVTLSDTTFCLEGDEEKITVLEQLLQRCGNSFFKLRPEQKVLYHASACMLSNYLVTLIHNGLKLMESIQVDSKTAYQAMLPLIQSSLLNISEFGASEALTGPIARGDVGTVIRQLTAVNTDCHEQLELYTLMSKETIKLARLSKLKDASKAKELETLVNSYI